MRGVFEHPKKSGIWWIHWYDHQGRRHREKVGRKSAATMLYHKRKTETLERKKLPELFRRAPPLFSELANDAIEYAKIHNRNARTDVLRITKLSALFGSRQADSIVPGEIDRALSFCKTGATFNRYKSSLSLIYRLGIEAGKTEVNPARRVRRRRESERVRWLNDEEEARLRKVVNETYPDRMRDIDFAINTGLRRGNQYALEWKDVDLIRGLAHIGRGKNGDPIHAELNANAIAALGKPGKGLVFSGTNRRKWFENSLKLAKIENFRWHDLRHTFASRLLMAGANVVVVKELLGHRTMNMTMRYAHLSPSHRRNAIMLLDAPKTAISATETAINFRRISRRRAANPRKQRTGV